MAAKFFCDRCGAEIEKTDKSQTIAEAEKNLLCENCLIPADKTLTSNADFWGNGEKVKAVIEKKGKRIFVNNREAKMKFNRIQLRLELLNGRGVYVIFDNIADAHPCLDPPMPIAKMFEELS